MVFTIRRKPAQKQRLLNIEEVFLLWDFLRAKYTGVEMLNIYVNYAHDADFKQILKSAWTKAAVILGCRRSHHSCRCSKLNKISAAL